MSFCNSIGNHHRCFRVRLAYMCTKYNRYLCPAGKRYSQEYMGRSCGLWPGGVSYRFSRDLWQIFILPRLSPPNEMESMKLNAMIQLAN